MSLATAFRQQRSRCGGIRRLMDRFTNRVGNGQVEGVRRCSRRFVLPSSIILHASFQKTRKITMCVTRQMFSEISFFQDLPPPWNIVSSRKGSFRIPCGSSELNLPLPPHRAPTFPIDDHWGLTSRLQRAVRTGEGPKVAGPAFLCIVGRDPKRKISTS